MNDFQLSEKFEILLIEDSSDDRFVFERGVITSGIPAFVSFAATAAEAINRLNRLGIHQSTPLPRLIVMDLGLPGINGKALLQAIRMAYGPQLVPVVILTGSRVPADRDACEGWLINAYLVKPSTMEGMTELVAKLPDLLERPSTDRLSRLSATLAHPPKPLSL